MVIIEPLEQELFEDEITNSEFEPVDNGNSEFDPFSLRQSQPSSRTGNPPDYVPIVDMNLGYKLIFLIEGFGSQTIGFASTYASTTCGDIGWGIF